MKKVVSIVISLACATIAAPAFSDPPEGRGYKKHHRHAERKEHKEEYWDGNCKVERKYEKNGDYKEERKCEGGPRYSRDDNYDYDYVYVPPPADDQPPPGGVVVDVVVPRPPVLVIEPPSVVVQPPRVTVR